MIIDLALVRARGKPLRVEREFPEDEFELQSAVLQLVSPVQVETEIRVSGKRVRVSGELAVEVDLTCCRCLSTLRRSLKKGFKLDYRPDPESLSIHEEALDYAELEIGFYHQDRLDLTDLVGEQILLELPINPVCQSSCKGLCDQCGINLNQGQCSCERQVLDPRLAVLHELKKKLES